MSSRLEEQLFIMDAEEIARLVIDLRVSDDIRNKAITITNEEVEKG